jgi:3-hydroxyisobutyrate dehydrogenase-like beta-hydroxyacid dehydrogenase
MTDTDVLGFIGLGVMGESMCCDPGDREALTVARGAAPGRSPHTVSGVRAGGALVKAPPPR